MNIECVMKCARIGLCALEEEQELALGEWKIFAKLQISQIRALS